LAAYALLLISLFHTEQRLISTYAKLTRYLPPKFSNISPNADRIVSKQW